MQTRYSELEKLLMECGGTYGYSHGERLIELVRLLSEGRAYDEGITEFCALTHDLGAFPKYASEGVDHAVRSLEVAEELLLQYQFTEREKETIRETIGAHHSAIMKKSFEAELFCNADALDFLGCIGIARDFARTGKDMVKAFDSVKKHRASLPPLLTLEAAKTLGKPRINEMDAFIADYESETFGK